MKFKKIICNEVPNKKDYYDIETISNKTTASSNLKGRFERSEIRHLIEVLDNGINVGG